MKLAAPAAGVLWLLLGCAAAAVPPDGPVSPPGEVPAPAAGAGADRTDRVGTPLPAGYGTLRQEEVTVSLRADALLVKVVPLDESVSRLLAPDTHQRLRALALARRAEAERVASSPALFLVSFFSHEPDVVFQSESLQLSHRGRLLRPAAILPISPTFGSQRLQQQETLLAVYIFDADIDYDQPITVRYGLQQSDAWTSVIPRLEVERGRVRARSGG